MGEPEVVLPLDDVVRELIEKREANAPGDAVVPHDIDAGDLGLLAAVLGESG